MPGLTKREYILPSVKHEFDQKKIENMEKQ